MYVSYSFLEPLPSLILKRMVPGLFQSDEHCLQALVAGLALRFDTAPSVSGWWRGQNNRHYGSAETQTQFDIRPSRGAAPLAGGQTPDVAARIVVHILIAQPALAPQVPNISAPTPYVRILANSRTAHGSTTDQVFARRI